jgi:hypothetical protein
MTKQYVHMYYDLDIYPGTTIALSKEHPWHVYLVTETDHGISRSGRYFATEAEAEAYKQELEAAL